MSDSDSDSLNGIILASIHSLFNLQMLHIPSLISSGVVAIILLPRYIMVVFN